MSLTYEPGPEPMSLTYEPASEPMSLTYEPASESQSYGIVKCGTNSANKIFPQCKGGNVQVPQP